MSEQSEHQVISEAGFSMNFGMISDVAGPCQVTFRGGKLQGLAGSLGASV